MHFTILNGMHPGQTQIDRIREIFESLITTSGHSFRTFTLHEYDIPWCRGDFYCWIKTPGECMLKGISSEIGSSLINGDVAVYLTPVTFGGYSSQLKKALDHQIGLISPEFKKIDGETHHKTRYERYPRLAGIGYLSESNQTQEETFTRLVGRNAINMHAPSHGVCFVYELDRDDSIATKIKLLFSKIGVKQ